MWRQEKRKPKRRAREPRTQKEADDSPVNYEEYILCRFEQLQAMGLGMIAAGAIAYTFYRSWLVFGILLIPACMLAFHVCRGYWRQRQQEQLEFQFKEMIQALSASLSAGYSFENALAVCRGEMEMMYGADGMVVRELEYMVRQMNMNRSSEAVLNDFARRSGLEEAQNFSYIFTIAKRSGGHLVSIISHTVQIMQDRFQVKEEIATLTASRKLEQRIMSLMPFAMVLYVDGTSQGFFDVMYTTAMGRIVMSGCLAVYVLSCYLSKRILDIKVG